MTNSLASNKCRFNDWFVNPIHNRIGEMDSVVVTHSVLMEAIDGIKKCISWSNAGSEPRGVLLVGNGGTGKTTVCNYILKSFPEYDLEEVDKVIRIIPAFFASVPSPSTIKSLASNLLEKLNDPAPQTGTAASMTKRICKLLKICQTKIIILDEFHNLLAKAHGSEARAVQVCNWIRSLINDTRVMICLVGIPTCEELVSHDSQMSRRFTQRFRLKELGLAGGRGNVDLNGFLRALTRKFVERLQLDGFVDFKDEENVKRMWAATSGNPAFVALLLKEATEVTFTAKRNTVVLSDFAEAYSRGITLSVTRVSENPFNMSYQALCSQIDRMAGESVKGYKC